ncbi:MAG: mycothiol biosynthesis acetyltransferase [Acidimicrobiales bacterium]|nr:mycothiol biosynthesis acetyltransferase [Acidimicrobiales bacterium]
MAPPARRSVGAVRHEIVPSSDGLQLIIDDRTIASVGAEHRGGELWLVPTPPLPSIVEPAPDIATLLDHAAVDAFEHGATAAHITADIPLEREDPHAEAVARLAGFTEIRDLLQLRRPLPVPAGDAVRHGRPPLAVRAFRPGTADEAAWVATNNRSFAHHPDQGAETSETLHGHMAEAWFDPAGLLVVDDDDPASGRLAGFCWTKIHPATDTDPTLGEIYVIGVDPTQGGHGLGRGLVLAGLDHLADRGVGTAMLYVDVVNTTALALYDTLGFGPHLRHRVWTRRPAAGRDRAARPAGEPK